MADDQDRQLAHASFRLWSMERNPLEAIQLLKLPFDHVHQRNEPRLTRTRRGCVREYSPYTQNMVCMTSKKWVTANSLEPHLEWLIVQLEDRKIELEQLFSTHWRGDLFCFLTSCSEKQPDIKYDIKERAGMIGLKISIDHYPNSPFDCQ